MNSKINTSKNKLVGQYLIRKPKEQTLEDIAAQELADRKRKDSLNETKQV